MTCARFSLTDYLRRELLHSKQALAESPSNSNFVFSFTNMKNPVTFSLLGISGFSGSVGTEGVSVLVHDMYFF